MKTRLTYMLLTTLMIVAAAIVASTKSTGLGAAMGYLAVGSLFALSYAVEVPEIFHEESSVSPFSFFLLLTAFWCVHLIVRSTQRIVELYSEAAS